MSRACSFHANKLERVTANPGDSLLTKAVLGAVSVVKVDRVQGGATVTVICVPPGNVCPQTHFPSDIRSPNRYHWHT